MTFAEDLRTGWRNSSLGVKLAVLGGIIILVMIAFSSGGSIVSYFKDRAFDRREAALKAEAEAHRQKANEAEAKARQLEGDVKVAELAIKAASEKAAMIAEKIQNEDKAFVDEMAAIGAAADLCDRVKRLCAKFKLKPEDCNC